MMFFFSKVLIVFFLPLGFFIFLTLILKKKFFKLTKLAAIILYFFSTGIVSEFLWRVVEYPWRRIDISEVPSAHSVVVLSGSGIYLKGKIKAIEFRDPDRFLAGIELYKKGKASQLMFTSAKLDKDLYTSDLYIQKALQFGIPSHSLMKTMRVRNTYDEAREVKRRLNKSFIINQNTIVLVTSAFHMNRAKGIFEREGMSVIPFPVDFYSNRNFPQALKNIRNWIPEAYFLSESTVAIKEIIGRIFYRTW